MKRACRSGSRRRPARRGVPMSQAEPPRFDKAARTRERILRAAVLVVAAKGYENATLAEIAKEAGYSIGALQSHFRTKVNLVVEAARQALVETLPPAEGEYPVTEQVESAVDPAEARLRSLNLEICVAARNHPEPASLMRELVEERAARLLERIEAGIEAGTIRADLDRETLTVVLATLYTGLACREAIGYPLPSSEDLVGLFETLLRPPD